MVLICIKRLTIKIGFGIKKNIGYTLTGAIIIEEGDQGGRKSPDILVIMPLYSGHFG